MGQKQPVEILQIEPWSNGACRGYVIHAMENAGFAHKDIQRVVDELHWVFDRFKRIIFGNGGQLWCKFSV